MCIFFLCRKLQNVFSVTNVVSKTFNKLLEINFSQPWSCNMKEAYYPYSFFLSLLFPKKSDGNYDFFPKYDTSKLRLVVAVFDLTRQYKVNIKPLISLFSVPESENGSNKSLH